jgi:hypothetical protein
MSAPSSFKTAARDGTFRAIRKLIAENPAIENREIALRAGCSIWMVDRLSPVSRIEFGVSSHGARQPYVEVDARRYRDACARINVTPIDIPKDGKVFRVKSAVAPTPPTPAPTIGRTPAHIAYQQQFREVFRYLAANPGVSNAMLRDALSLRNFGIAADARLELGLRWSSGRGMRPSGYRVRKAVYEEACRKHGVAPIPFEDSEVMFTALQPSTPFGAPGMPTVAGRHKGHDLLLFLAQNPGASGKEVRAALVLKDSTMASRARKELGIRRGGGASHGYTVVKEEYLKGCKKHGIEPLPLESDTFFPSDPRELVTVSAERALVRQQRSGTVTKKTDRRIKHLRKFPLWKKTVAFFADNPAATDKEVFVAVGANDTMVLWARRALGIVRFPHLDEVRVEGFIYHSSCTRHGVSPRGDIPSVGTVTLHPSKPAPFATSIATVPTSEVPPEVLAATPPDVQPPRADTPVTTQGNDELAQLRGIIDLLRTEMAKRRIESVKVDPGGVTIRRTVVVEEPFV